ncbi:allophanate hydrolase subunit 1 [Streptomyces sp. ISL-94]|uniref:5-oxoprolinase subunit B family protein n=1 Tax=Streptomyces sp. ISL-94 TaxID=2819190 RepID=UPI001BE7A044|nr:allophanate hydrolase subunit 1 [Streptomyces sp. ISL-94]MBT2477182.1 allophanate hydrolase subunit 1 [Streptomyces sp. ISL-94]
MRILSYGTRALLAEVSGLDQVARLHAALRRHPLPGVLELVPAARTLLIRYDRVLTDRTRLVAALGALDLRAVPPVEAETVVIPVRYQGEDLPEVARLSGLTVPQVIARHTAATYQVAFCGFAPGFAYLTGVDPALRVPRRTVPRTRVPAGAVALADEFTGVYPRESPGGWQLLGSTELTLWNPAADPPSLLTPGTAVRFRDVTADGAEP